MMELVFATNNRHKLHEVRELAGSDIHILSLGDIGCFDDIPEDADTLEGNASIKSRYIFNIYGRDCFADDTGSLRARASIRPIDCSNVIDSFI